jgi:hypothetical protein
MSCLKEMVDKKGVSGRNFGKFAMLLKELETGKYIMPQGD